MSSTICLFEKVFVGNVSGRGSVRQECVWSGKCVCQGCFWSRKCPSGMCLVEEVSVEDVSGRGNVVGDLSGWEVSIGDVSGWGNVSRGSVFQVVLQGHEMKINDNKRKLSYLYY